MAYIRKMKNKEGRIYVYLVEGYRENGKVKSRILEKYGEYRYFATNYKRFKSDKDKNRNYKKSSTIEYLHCLIKK